VTELRVYSGLAKPSPPPDDDPAEEAPAEPPPPEKKMAGTSLSGVYLRLGLTFAVYFVVTTMIVLGTWFAVVRPLWVQETERRAAVLAPQVIPAPVVAPIPPEPEPVAVAEVDEEEALDESAPAAEETEEPAAEEPEAAPEPEPKPARAASRPRPRPVRRTPPPEPEPEPEVADMEEPVPMVEPPPPEPEPEPEPPPPTVAKRAVVPIAAARQSGTYVGKVQNGDFTMQLVFRPGGVLQGILEVERDGETVNLGAAGNYTIGADDVITIALVEAGTANPRVYSGQVADGVAEGRVSEGGRNRGRFRAKR